jgi:hypothetical protein
MIGDVHQIISQHVTLYLAQCEQKCCVDLATLCPMSLLMILNLSHYPPRLSLSGSLKSYAPAPIPATPIGWLRILSAIDVC